MATKAEKLLAKGRKLEARGKLEKAIVLYREVSVLDSYDPDVRVTLGDAAVELGDTKEGSEALFRAADLHFRGGLLEAALALARRVVELDPQHSGGRLFVRKLEPRIAARTSGPMVSVAAPGAAMARAPTEPPVARAPDEAPAARAPTEPTLARASTEPPAAAGPARISRSQSVVTAGEGASRERAGAHGSMPELTPPELDPRLSLPSIIVDPTIQAESVPSMIVSGGAARDTSGGPDEDTLDLPLPESGRARRPSLTDTLVSMVADEPEDAAVPDEEALAVLSGPTPVEIAAEAAPASAEVHDEFEDAPATRPIRPLAAGAAPSAPPEPEPEHVSPASPRDLAEEQAMRPPRARRFSGPIDMPPLDADTDALTPDVLSLADLLSTEPSPAGAEVEGIEIPLDDEPVRKTIRAAASSIAGSALLSELDQELVDRLFDAGTFTQLRAGKSVFEQGERGTSLYIILRGQVDVMRRFEDGERRLATLRPGGFFGEMSLLTNLPRTATVRARTEALLLEVPRKEVRALIGQDASILKLLMRFFRARLVGTLLEISPLFGGFTKEEKKDLVKRFRLREVGGSRQLITEGEPVEGLYLVLAGSLDVERSGELIADLGAGDVIGEISLLDQGGATASVWTRTKTWLLLLPRDEFRGLIQTHAAVREHLVQVAAERRAPIDGSRLEPV